MIDSDFRQKCKCAWELGIQSLISSHERPSRLSIYTHSPFLHFLDKLFFSLITTQFSFSSSSSSISSFPWQTLLVTHHHPVNLFLLLLQDLRERVLVSSWVLFVWLIVGCCLIECCQSTLCAKKLYLLLSPFVGSFFLFSFFPFIIHPPWKVLLTPTGFVLKNTALQLQVVVAGRFFFSISGL